MNILLKIKNYEHFSKNEQMIAHYILEHGDEVMRMSTRELAHHCFVSVAAIYRFLDKLDIKGYNDFKVALSLALVSHHDTGEEFNFNFPIRARETPFKVVQKMKEDYLKTIEATIDLIDLETLRQAVNAMKKAQVIDVFTSAGNVYMAENFKLQMLEIGIQVNVPELVYEKEILASITDETHFAIVITFEGNGAYISEITDVLRKQKAKILLISSPDFYMNADYHLYMMPNEHVYRKVSAFSSRLSCLYLLDILYLTYFSSDYEINMKKKADYYERIRPYLKKAKP